MGLLNFGQLVFFFLALAFVVILAIFVTRLVASQKMRGFNKNIKIVESIGFANNSGISILKVGKQYILVGITKENITFLQNLKEEDLDLSFPNYQASFKKHLEKYLTRKGDKNE